MYGVFGYPLGHTFSPPMHNRVFQKLGMDALYLPIEVAPENLSTVFSGLVLLNYKGFNVTIPHKVGIMALLDEIDPLARVIGAVNTVTVENGRTTGSNTDAPGFTLSLKLQRDATVRDKTVFILGSGGGARAIVVASADQGARRIYLCNRTRSRAESLAADVNSNIRDIVRVLPMEESEQKKVMPQCDILVNTTSIGMHPHTGAIPIAESLLHPDLLVVDIVYNPLKTRLMAAAEQIGCTTLGGLGMLVYQGAESFRIWTGRDPLIDDMFEVVKEVKLGIPPGKQAGITD